MPARTIGQQNLIARDCRHLPRRRTTPRPISSSNHRSEVESTFDLCNHSYEIRVSVTMDCYVAPLRIVKRTNLSLQKPTADEYDPVPIPKRSSSITSDSWFTSISTTPTDPPIDISSSPPLDARKICLDVPKVRKGAEKSRSWSRKKNRQPDDSALESSEEASRLTDEHLETGSHDDGQVTNNTSGQRTPHKLFDFLHIFEKISPSLPSHGLSKRILDNSHPVYPVNRNNQFLRSDFTMQNPTPLTILKMDLQPERLVRGSKHTELYARIAISADVELASEPVNQFSNYIDNVVLLNIKSVYVLSVALWRQPLDVN